ncbi:putative lipoprotein [Treponema socranskii subsp. socranskii VPI DR56BR1116 = ATCC 35536]|uniref:Lipoprotein n=1 Tax=Treponema socranskii subsp. socranskii VPI DR56BR1116 = ATCC 35536 TaxID=1125725 RepID=U1GN93_TRESO|nr:hypothetical protein [Treponema socranskii]ERF59505.1 putative lipoprotein [Treponema socranskii subsp. socranskii VPI DR56BR1116 = ATCC 35536]ERK04866.1 putative lipoprotein [Treponema socranskii subsp. socranskii VPI DR56BR1116 = ATCC 35536]
MKKTLFVLAALAVVLIGFSACSNGSSDDNGGGGAPSDQHSDLYGSYWGTLTMVGKDFPLCLVIEADKVALHSDVMGMAYPLVTYKDEGNGTWTISCYDKGEDTTKPTTHTTVSVDTKASPFIAKATIIPMSCTTAPLKKGKAYNNEYAH